MSKNLVIVESPAKSKTIEKYLGSDYKVLSSKGHIRDLATSGKYGFGVDIEDGFKPNYEPIKGKKKDIAELKKEVKNAEKVYLATDPDREGEAISWHLKDALGIDDKDYERIVFNEITKNAVVNSFKNARKIDDLMVRSQETRRILDRIIGFRLSKLMQSKTGGKSAGRVQSVALKLIVDREKEIEKFIPEEYWTIKAIFPSFDANLFGYKENTKLEIKNEIEAKDILNVISNYSKALDLLDDYDHGCISKPKGKDSIYQLTYEECRNLIDSMKYGGFSDVFGVEKEPGKLNGIIAAVYQNVFGQEIYPSIEEKAANLLYFLVKDHPFVDGCKRIGASIFLEFLNKNQHLIIDGKQIISDSALVAITLMIAESRPEEKETMVKLVMNFLKA